MDNNKDKPYFFISFKQIDKDKGYLEWLKNALEEIECTYVTMESFKPGGNFRKSIDAALITTSGTISVITKNYFDYFADKGWCYDEFDAAEALCKEPNGSYALIPILFEEAYIPPSFKHANYIDFRNKNDREKREELKAIITSLNIQTKQMPTNDLRRPAHLVKKKHIKSYWVIISILAITLLSIYVFLQLGVKFNSGAKTNKITGNFTNHAAIKYKPHVIDNKIQPKRPAKPKPTPIAKPTAVVAYVHHPNLPQPTITSISPKINIAGIWIGFFTKFTSAGKTILIPFTMNIKENGNKIRGIMKNKMFGVVHRGHITGTINGRHIFFVTTYAFSTSKYLYSGKISKNKFEGKGTWKYHYKNGKWLIAKPDANSKIVNVYNKLKNARKSNNTSNIRINGPNWGSVFRNLFK